MTDRKPERRGLKRGLSAFIADIDTAPDDPAPTRASNAIPVEKIRPNPDQPRRQFNQEDLDSLTASIREKGVIQPLLVRIDPTDSNLYQIVAGERRWRAAQAAQLHELPVIVKDLTDAEVLEIAIIENIQRADLNPVEEALGYRQLQQKFEYTQEQMSVSLGKSRSHIANLLRLLKLPDDVLQWLRDGALSAGHARALITADRPSELAKTVIAKGLSVRETERLAQATTTPTAPPKKVLKKDADTAQLESDLSAALGLKVSITHMPGKQSGKLSIDYKNIAQLDDMCRRLAGNDEN